MFARSLLLVASLLLLSIPASSASASFIQQGSKLVGTGATGAAAQGWSVAVSADGGTAIVGGYRDNGFTGAVWIYTRSNGMWIQQGSKLIASGAVGSPQLGISVALSADGNTAIAGGYLDNSNLGAAWVFTRSGGVWSQQAKLVGTGAVGGSRQGRSVALSADGNTAIVGGQTDDTNVGAIWVFTRSGTVWTQQGPKLVGTGAVGGAEQGFSVAVSEDGNTAMVGGHSDDALAGAIWIFTRSSGVWSQQGPKLVGTGAAGVAEQGRSVAVSSDGNTAVVGGNRDNGFRGAMWVFTRSAGVWTQQGGKLIGTDGAGSSSSLGSSVAVSGDGNTAVAGGLTDATFTGATWVFTRSAGVWSQLGLKLVGTGAVGMARQGVSVALSTDGETAIVGGDDDSSTAGAAWVFVPSDRVPALDARGLVVIGGLMLLMGVFVLRRTGVFA